MRVILIVFYSVLNFNEKVPLDVGSRVFIAYGNMVTILAHEVDYQGKTDKGKQETKIHQNRERYKKITREIMREINDLVVSSPRENFVCVK